MIGEARHRRSYLYELTPGSETAPSGARRTRLFHNNTVRTIAPEYIWVAVGRRHQAAGRRRTRRRHGVARARRLSDGSVGAGVGRRAQEPRRGESRGGTAPCATTAAGCSRRSPRRWRTSRRSISAGRVYAHEKALVRLRLEAHHQAGQQARVRVPLQRLRVVRLHAGVPVVRAAQCARRPDRERPRDARRARSIRSSSTSSAATTTRSRSDPARTTTRRGRRRCSKRRACWPGIRCRRRSSSPRSPARRPACSAAASSCGRRSRTEDEDRRRAEQRHDRLGERPSPRQHDPLLEPRHPRHPAWRGDRSSAT